MLGEIIADLSSWMYTYLLVILLVAAGLFSPFGTGSRSCSCCREPSAWWWSAGGGERVLLPGADGVHRLPE